MVRTYILDGVLIFCYDVIYLNTMYMSFCIRKTELKPAFIVKFRMSSLVVFLILPSLIDTARILADQVTQVSQSRRKPRYMSDQGFQQCQKCLLFQA